MQLKLLVLRTADIHQLAEFYMVLGMRFEAHQHGNSPLHYSGSLGTTVLEIYPLTKNQTEADKHVRLGFSLDDFDATLSQLKALGTPILSEPAATEFGFSMVIADPDGRKLELYKN